MRKIRTTCSLALVALTLTVIGTIGTAWVRAADGGGETSLETTGTPGSGAPATGPSAVAAPDNSAIFYSIAVTVAVSCLSAGYAVGKVGAAALGAAAEKPELLGRAIIFVGLAEGIAIYGLIIGLFLINKLG